MSYFRKAIDAIEGYTPGEQPKLQRLVKLNTNENPFPPSPKVIENLSNLTGDHFRRYPTPAADELREAASRLTGRPVDWILAGNGSDDILTVAVRSFVDQGGSMGAMYPTYSLYEVLAGIQGAGFRHWEFTDVFDLPEEVFDNDLPLVLVPNPNAPTGTLLGLDRLKALAESMTGILLVDEAYIDFAGPGATALPLLDECPNVVVSRTLSKSYSLAGLRAGFAVARPEVVAGMMKVKDSYNVNRVTSMCAAAALDDAAYFAQCTGRIVELREQLSEGLVQLGFTVIPSRANFVLCTPPERPTPEGFDTTAEWLYTSLKQRGILVRYFKHRRLDDKLRITVGLPEEIKELLSALREMLG